MHAKVRFKYYILIVYFSPPFSCVWQTEMVNTRRRQATPQDGQEATASTADQPNTVAATAAATSLPPRPPILGGGPEQIARMDLAPQIPILTEATPESRILDTVMQAVTAAMAKQQEHFMKMLEDRDANNRRPETVAEIVEIAGSGGAADAVATGVAEVKQGGKACSYKSFLCCKPPEFSGSADPVACMNWIREIEQAFEACECEEGQKVRFGSQMLRGPALIWWNVTKASLEGHVLAMMDWITFKRKVMEEYCNERAMDRIEDEFRNLKKGNQPIREYNRLFMEKLGLVGHVAPTEKEKVKACLKGLPAGSSVKSLNPP